MKKLFLIAATTIAALSFAACDKKDSGNDNPPVTDPNPLTEGVTVEAYYAGVEEEDSPAATYWINFHPDNFEMDEDGNIISSDDGYVLCISFRAPKSDNPDRATLGAGEYGGDEDGALNTFIINDVDESFLTRKIDGKSMQSAIIGGTVKIELSAEKGYIMTCNLTINGGEKYEYKYVGPVVFHNITEEGKGSTLTSDRTLTALDHGYITMFGESIFDGATSDMARIVLGDANFNIETLLGKGNGVVIDFNIPQGATTIPDGTYNMLPTDATNIPAGTLVPGLKYYSFYYGCWYLGGQDEASLRDGTVAFKCAGETYDVTFTLKDGYGNTVSGSYKGKLTPRALEE